MARKITSALRDWFCSSDQELPWRGIGDPYAIWLSEVMLQQTRIATVIPYWTRFIENYPDPRSLAAAPQDAVLEMWAGLGYYSRGKNLHAAAKMITQQYDGQFPRDPEQVRKLPGIGEYTTAAICSIAFNEPLAVIDGNVERVLCRYHKIDGDPRKGAARLRLRKAADEALDQKNPGDHNQAMMDLGRTICTPRSPDCHDCPLSSSCGAKATKDPTQWPHRRPKRPTEEQWWASAVIVADQEVLLWTGDSELLAGHRGPPLVQLSGPGLDAEQRMTGMLKQLQVDKAILLGHADRFRHAITHRKLEIFPLVYQWHGKVPQGVATIPLDGGSRLAALHRKSIAAARELLLEVSQ